MEEMTLVSNNNLYNSNVNFQQAYTNADSVTNCSLKANLSSNKKCKQKPQILDDLSTNEQSNSNKTGQNGTALSICVGCNFPIRDQYVCVVMNSSWHEECLKCSYCGQLLKGHCFTKKDSLYCKEDFKK